MKQFKDFGIKPLTKGLTGDKIKIERILNREITIHDYRVVDSKFEKGCKKCLHLQIEIGDTKHVVFTGSSILMETIQQISKDQMPFRTTIIRENERFEFS